ncbi:hypothetical protein TRIP_C21482 [Candidatus Zixiibacteriota bacterium]|nr:hypothetical protein TRIP_C21482 [candidate division Zixibacteria bacterium]
MKLRTKLLLIPFGTIFVILLGLYLALFQFDLLEYLVNRKIRDLIGSNLPLKVRIGHIGGDYLSYLNLTDVYAEYDNGKDRYVLATIPRLSAQYSISNLWHGKLIFKSIEIDSAQLSLAESPEGKWLIPEPKESRGGSSEGIDLEIDRVLFKNITFNLYSISDTLVFSRLLLDGQLKIAGETYAAQIDTVTFESSDNRLNLQSGRGKFTFSNGNLVYQDVAIFVDSTNFISSGQVQLKDNIEAKATIDAARLNLPQLSSLLGTRLSGNLAVSGDLNYGSKLLSGNLRVAGTFENREFDSLHVRFRYADNILNLDSLDGTILAGCRIEGHGGIDLGAKPETYNLLAEIRNFNLNNVVSETFKTNLNGDISLSGQGLTGSTLSLNISADLDESWFDEYHAHKATGAMIVTTGGIDILDKFAVEYGQNTFLISGSLDYNGRVDLNGSTHFDDLAAFNGQTFIEKMGGRGDLEFKVSGELKNPDISGNLRSDSLWIYEIYSSQAIMDFQLTHFLYDRNGSVNVHLFDGEAYKLPFDTILADLKVDSIDVRFDTSYFHNSISSASARGMLEYASYPQRLSIDSLTLDIVGLSLNNDSLIIISIDSSGYNIKRARLKRSDGYLAGEGRVNYDESLKLKIDLDRINIVPLVKLLDTAIVIGGRMSGEFLLNGNFESPLIDFAGRIDTLTYDDFNLGDLTADLNYANKAVNVDSIIVDSHTGRYVARGIFPIDLSFRVGGNRFTGVEQNIDFTAQDTRLDAVGLFLEEVEKLDGDVTADFKLTGTPQNPKVNGRINLRKGRLKIADLVNPLENVMISMSMNNQTVTVDSMAATCSDGKKLVGAVSGSGQIIINSINQFDYNLAIKLTDFPGKYELGDIEGVINANLKVRGLTPPTVSGDVTVLSATYRENFARESDGWIILTSLEGAQSWDLNLDVEIPNKLWIKNDDIDAEFSGRLNFIREKGNYRYIGSLEILRGKGYLADRIFQIESGGSINYENIESPNPTLDIYASTKVRGAAPSTQGSPTETSNYELRVHITGTLEEPTIEAAPAPEGSPQFTTEEIIPLIFTNYYNEKSNAVGTSERFSDRLTSGISGYLSTQMTQIGSRTLGVETFEIDPVYGNKFDPLGTRLTVGFYTHPNLYIYGRSALSGESGREVGFEYRIKRFLLLEGSRDDANLYHLLLNLYWDY